jgi:hypothetical protein
MLRFILLLLPLVLGTAVQARAQQGTHLMPGRDSAGLERMGMMMDHRMMARMDSLDARLDSLTRVMASASGTRKINAMSAVLSALVAQHLAMHRMMHEHMMGMMGMPAAQGDSTAAPDDHHDH